MEERSRPPKMFYTVHAYSTHCWRRRQEVVDKREMHKRSLEHNTREPTAQGTPNSCMVFSLTLAPRTNAHKPLRRGDFLLSCVHQPPSESTQRMKARQGHKTLEDAFPDTGDSGRVKDSAR